MKLMLISVNGAVKHTDIKPSSDLFSKIRHLMGDSSITLEKVNCQHKDKSCDMYVDEDGLAKQLSYNEHATIATGIYVVGDVVIVEP